MSSPCCSVLTKKGSPCKLRCVHGLSTCYVHTPIEQVECHICMNAVSVRKSVKFPCGHSMCVGCNTKWKNMGKYTCPFCRDYIYIDTIDKCIKTTFTLLEECQNTVGKHNKIHVMDKIFRVLSSVYGKQLINTYTIFKNTVHMRLDKFDEEMRGTPEHTHVDQWRKYIAQ